MQEPLEGTGLSVGGILGPSTPTLSRAFFFYLFLFIIRVLHNISREEKSSEGREQMKTALPADLRSLPALVF